VVLTRPSGERWQTWSMWIGWVVLAGVCLFKLVRTPGQIPTWVKIGIGVAVLGILLAPRPFESKAPSGDWRPPVGGVDTYYQDDDGIPGPGIYEIFAEIQRSSSDGYP